MSALWTSADAVAATGGSTTSDWKATGVSIDTRTISEGDLFVALSDQRDGHDFVADAFAKGAAAALVSRRPDGVEDDAPLLLVDDVLDGLRALGRAARDRFAGKVIGVTGSVGKTSAKEMLRTVLARQGTVHAAEASYNNHWGVPLTLARMPADADFAVIEIGMNHPGEIAPLSKLARPHAALITTVAPAHIAAFENIEGIAVEKASIMDGVVPGGSVVFHADIGTADILRSHAEETELKIETFGESASAGWRLTEVSLNGNTTSARARLPDDEVLFRINSAGRHFAMNALGVLAVAAEVGADVALASRDMMRWQPPAGRGTRETIQLDPVEAEMTIELIDDAYNANPTSMAAALEVLSVSTPKDGVGRVRRGRRIAILGDMLELGAREREDHAAIAALPQIGPIDRVHCAGPRMAALYDALPEHKRGEYRETADELARVAHRLVDAGDVVLVKGSLGSRVSRVVDAIRKLGHPRSSDTEDA